MKGGLKGISAAMPEVVMISRKGCLIKVKFKEGKFYIGYVYKRIHQRINGSSDHIYLSIYTIDTIRKDARAYPELFSTNDYP